MPLLVDGHNLIPKIPGLSLSDPEDEMQLLQLLQDYCRIRRQEAECFFDLAPFGHPRRRKFGTIRVKFARAGKTADDEIKDRLAELGRQARSYIVISSDLSVQNAARAARARVKTSEDFSAELIAALREGNGPGKKGEDHPDERAVGPDEVDMWIKIFKKGKKD